jgi:hypothetical protein
MQRVFELFGDPLHHVQRVLKLFGRGVHELPSNSEMFGRCLHVVRTTFEQFGEGLHVVQKVSKLFREGLHEVQTGFEMFGDGPFWGGKAPAKVETRSFLRSTKDRATGSSAEIVNNFEKRPWAPHSRLGVRLVFSDSQ